VTYNQEKLHQKKYFSQLVKESEELPEALKPLLKLGRDTVERAIRSDKALVRALQRDPLLATRVQRLTTIPGVGPITALTWALEIGEVNRFASGKHAASYCGLCSAENSSAGIQKRSPISKQRNKHLQTVLIEAAKLAPRWNSDLALVHAKELERGNRNRATLAVARKMVAYLLAVDRRDKPFQGAKKPRLKTAA
jgi:transposase